MSGATARLDVWNAVIAALLLGACTGEKATTTPSSPFATTDADADADSDADADADADSDTDADTDTDTLDPSLVEGLGADCSTDFAEHVLTAYYVGDLRIDGDAVSGTETMYFVPSDALDAACDLEPSCVVVWNLAGERLPTAVDGFEFAVAVDAERDVTRTTCSATYRSTWEPDSYSATYAVDAGGDVAFEGSGVVFASGSVTDDRVTYVTDKTCAPLADPPPCP